LPTGISSIQEHSDPMDTCGLVAELAHYIDAYGEFWAPENPIEPTDSFSITTFCGQLLGIDVNWATSSPFRKKPSLNFFAPNVFVLANLPPLTRGDPNQLAVEMKTTLPRYTGHKQRRVHLIKINVHMFGDGRPIGNTLIIVMTSDGRPIKK